ncbi:hypothetical protein [Ancylobacter sp.]|uniref:hypothetical protein n=1 Tax=Ancylobacter sp. TaxID=1872567 RepID=UPI003BACA81E
MAKSPREIEDEAGIARDYDGIAHHPSDNAYLYYIHFRIGHTNKLLGEIKLALSLVCGCLAGIAIVLWIKL